MSASQSAVDEGSRAFADLLVNLRPKLHRYCARMTGSVIDGEDVVQEALIKAMEAFAGAQPIDHPEGWLFRIAHNASLDFLRRRARQEALHRDEDLDMTADPEMTPEQKHVAAASLGTLMRLPVAQRSSIILMDVLGYSLQEISEITAAGVPAIKAALHRGRTRLQELAAQPEDRPMPVLGELERARLAAYVDRFNARDFDAIRNILADEVRLDLVAKVRMNGRKQVETYFSNYSQGRDWRFAPGFVERRPAVLVYNPQSPTGVPGYFVLLEWDGGKLAAIRDFRYARYVVEKAEIVSIL
jgi:RNA polymerase sigma-70 factor (ECF subfamily)